MKMRGAELICRLLERQGIECVAGIPGGANLPLYDALYDSEIRHILARHEQGAGFIAQGMARVTGKAAVCLATSGPGATNLLTAIADARMDSVPVVAITGQVASTLIGTDAFQEVDTYGLTCPITKHNYLVRSAAELLEVIPEAFELAQSGRPGPVVVDVPKNVQLAEVEFAEYPEPGVAAEPSSCAPELIEHLAELIRRSSRPVLYMGGGVIASNAGALVRQLAQRISAPVTSTLMGLGAVPCDDPLYLGMLGMHGAKSTNLILEEADLLVAIGARFDDRAVGQAAEFCKHADIAHIDIDPSEIDKIKTTNVSIVGDAGMALRQLLSIIEPQERADWLWRVQELKASFPLREPSPEHPLGLCRLLGEWLDEDVVIATDVGQHQMWTAQGYPFRKPRRWLTSGGLGTMGFGLPAAIGAALALPDRRVVCISGDGSLLMNLQELATLAELNLDVTVVLMNNAHLGLVRQQQELFYNQRYHAVRFQTKPDFASIARGFGVQACDLANSNHLLDDLRTALKKQGPALINVPIHCRENVYPMVPPGASNCNMIEGEASAESVLAPMPCFHCR